MMIINPVITLNSLLLLHATLSSPIMYIITPHISSLSIFFPIIYTLRRREEGGSLLHWGGFACVASLPPYNSSSISSHKNSILFALCFETLFKMGSGRISQHACLCSRTDCFLFPLHSLIVVLLCSFRPIQAFFSHFGVVTLWLKKAAWRFAFSFFLIFSLWVVGLDSYGSVRSSYPWGHACMWLGGVPTCTTWFCATHTHSSPETHGLPTTYLPTDSYHHLPCSTCHPPPI